MTKINLINIIGAQGNEIVSWTISVVGTVIVALAIIIILKGGLGLLQSKKKWSDLTSQIISVLSVTFIIIFLLTGLNKFLTGTGWLSNVYDTMSQFKINNSQNN